MEQYRKLTSAPIDEKNVTSDWIARIFDNEDYVENGDKFVGFVKGYAVSCHYWKNHLYWGVFKDFAIPRELNEVRDELERRLKTLEDEDEDGNVFSIRERLFDNAISQSFYFKE